MNVHDPQMKDDVSSIYSLRLFHALFLFHGLICFIVFVFGPKFDMFLADAIFLEYE